MPAPNAANPGFRYWLPVGLVLLGACSPGRPPLTPIPLELPANEAQEQEQQSRWLRHIKDARPAEEKSGNRSLGGLSVERLGDKQFTPAFLFQLEQLLLKNIKLNPREKVLISSADILHAYNMNELPSFAPVHRQLDYLIPLLHRSTPQQLPQFLSCRIKGKFRSRYFEVIVAEKFEAPGFLDSLDHTERSLATLVQQCLEKAVAKIKKNCDC